MIRKIDRRGKRVLVIDIRWKKPDGSKGRYRHDAQVQTLAAATAEERRLVANITQYGDIHEPRGELRSEVAVEGRKLIAATSNSRDDAEPTKSTTFGEVVAKYRATYMVTDLKVTTRKGYGQVLDAVLLPRFADRPIVRLDGEAAVKLDLVLTKEKLAKSTRNNAQIVLRSVLRFAKERGDLREIPPGLPRLRRPEPSILEIPTDDQVTEILRLACPTQRRAFGLMAFAGLRPNEVRALLRRDMKLRRDGDQAVGGFLSIREGLSFGETHTPKTGVREVPIARRLAVLLGDVEKGPRDGHLAVTVEGEPWGRPRRLVRVLASALRDHELAPEGGPRARRPEDGGAQEPRDDAALRALPQGRPRGSRPSHRRRSRLASPARRRRGQRQPRQGGVEPDSVEVESAAGRAPRGVAIPIIPAGVATTVPFGGTAARSASPRRESEPRFGRGNSGVTAG